MYAVVRTGGKQIRVQPGDVVDVELLGAAAGERVELGEVLLIGGGSGGSSASEGSGDDAGADAGTDVEGGSAGGGGALRVGQPLVDGAKVVATVEGEAKGPKLKIFKFKRRKRYRLHKGHRQHYTRLRIESIEG